MTARRLQLRPQVLHLRLARGQPRGSRLFWQADIIVYGTDLANYVDIEVGGSEWLISPDWAPPPMVSFWSEFL